MSEVEQPTPEPDEKDEDGERDPSEKFIYSGGEIEWVIPPPGQGDEAA